MDWYTLLVATHIIGTALGVGAATFSEIFLIKALRDGHVDPVESDFLRTTYRVIRIGLLLLVLSGFGFLLLYRTLGLTENLVSPLIWSKLTIVGIILLNAILLQARKVPLWLGSALSITSWYSAMLIMPIKSLLFANNAGYWHIIGGYILSVLVMAAVLTFIRRLFGVKH